MPIEIKNGDLGFGYLTLGERGAHSISDSTEWE
jgi:hypothetical protein